MGQSFAEKRSSPRTFFDSIENVAATIACSGNPFSANVLNLSSGGLQFSQERNGAVVLQPGDTLNLVGLVGVAGLQFVEDVTMEVRWIIDQSFLSVISAGCQFVDLSDEHQQQIELVVETRSLSENIR